MNLIDFIVLSIIMFASGMLAGYPVYVGKTQNEAGETNGWTWWGTTIGSIVAFLMGFVFYLNWSCACK